MYTLRIIEETRKNEDVDFDKVIENHELGTAYSKIEKGVTKEFDSIMVDLFKHESKDDVKSLICGENEKVFFVLESNSLRNNTYFIMTESGKTFEKI